MLMREHAWIGLHYGRFMAGRAPGGGGGVGDGGATG
jgi:hypothetical protein